MAHSLLEQEYTVQSSNNLVDKFIKDVLGLDSTSSSVYAVNSGGNTGFKVSGYQWKLGLVGKNKTEINTVEFSSGDKIFYHLSSGENVKYFKCAVPSNSSSFTYLLAEDESGEWVVFNADKMYSDYGASGIYTNAFDGGNSKIVDGGNRFLFSRACRVDTGANFKELFFVLSATSYSDSNCIVRDGDRLYRLVSVSNVKDESGRFPAFAFPVSD